MQCVDMFYYISKKMSKPILFGKNDDHIKFLDTLLLLTISRHLSVQFLVKA
jgi:hypothetical protein